MKLTEMIMNINDDEMIYDYKFFQSIFYKSIKIFSIRIR